MTEHSALLEEISGMLMESELFSHLPATELMAAAHYFGLNRIAQDEVIFYEGDEGHFMCLIHSGSIAVTKQNQDGAPVQIANLKAGRAFGEMAVLDGERRSATCIAADDCELLSLSSEALEKMMEEHPRVGSRIISAIAVSLSRRLRMAVGQLVDHIV